MLMSIEIRCGTRFDITRTDIRGHFPMNRLPFRDRAGQWITDQMTWNRSRNQQLNLDTVMQIISLRVLPEDVTDPVFQDDHWSFRFRVPMAAGVAWGADPVGALRYDANGVPMVQDPGQSRVTGLISYGADATIWFEILDGK